VVQKPAGGTAIDGSIFANSSLDTSDGIFTATDLDTADSSVVIIAEVKAHGSKMEKPPRMLYKVVM
jgi:hypothetical protein